VVVRRLLRAPPHPAQVVTQNLNPIWSFSTTLALDAEGVVRLRLLDWDEISANDPMGEARFRASDVPASAVHRGSPNTWLPVAPTDGCRCSGRLLVRYEWARHRPVAVPASMKKTLQRLERMPKLSPGPALQTSWLAKPEKQREKIAEMVRTAVCPVFFHVYDVGKSKHIRRLNRVTEVVGGGVFHGAIEVCGAEFSFGGCRAQRSGVFKCEPTKCPMHGYRESAYLGDCGLKPPQVQAILAALSPNWYGPTYDLIRKNCCSFSKAFAVELGVGPVPAWSHRLADAGAALGVMKKTVEDDDIDDVLFEHVMAVRLQRGFRARKEAREKAQLEAKRHREAARAAI